jgi:hypothetical protein
MTDLAPTSKLRQGGMRSMSHHTGTNIGIDILSQPENGRKPR